MDDPAAWLWVWLLVAGAFAAAEIFVAGTFFMLPFAAGALAAAVTALVGGGLVIQWTLFIAVSVAAALALIPLRKRLDATGSSDGIGSRRLIGQQALVLTTISGGAVGFGEVRIGREEWRAESADDTAIAAGTTVRVIDVRGTSVVVVPVATPVGGHMPPGPPSSTPTPPASTPPEGSH